MPIYNNFYVSNRQKLLALFFKNLKRDIPSDLALSKGFCLLSHLAGPKIVSFLRKSIAIIIYLLIFNHALQTIRTQKNLTY